MKHIQSEETLLEQLVEDVLATDKDRIVIHAGHFPLQYAQDCYEDLYDWGAFTKYSLELAGQVAQKAKEAGKEVSFAFIADDLMYVHSDQMNESSKKKKRKRFYKEKEGEGIHEELLDIIQEYGFSSEDVMRFDHGVKGRRDQPYYSELIARASDHENSCAKAYSAFLTELDPVSDYLVSFIPTRCTGNVCSGVLDKEDSPIQGSHVFTLTDTEVTKHVDTPEKIWSGKYFAEGKERQTEGGVLYRKD